MALSPGFLSTSLILRVALFPSGVSSRGVEKYFSVPLFCPFIVGVYALDGVGIMALPWITLFLDRNSDFYGLGRSFLSVGVIILPRVIFPFFPFDRPVLNPRLTSILRFKLPVFFFRPFFGSVVNWILCPSSILFFCFYP